MSLGIEEAERMGSPAHAHPAIQVLAYGDGAAGQRAPEWRFVQLPETISNRHRVVLGYRSLRLDREHLLEISTGALAERCPLLARGLANSRLNSAM
jgi:hypothetical protein